MLIPDVEDECYSFLQILAAVNAVPFWLHICFLFQIACVRPAVYAHQQLCYCMRHSYGRGRLLLRSYSHVLPRAPGRLAEHEAFNA
jgi:hypothetical protein